jgi:hypothetical protein
MPKNINSRYTFLKYLDENKSIALFSNQSEFLFIFRVNDAGTSFELWDHLAPPFLNAFSDLETYKGYAIISKTDNLPYNLFTNPDKFICTEIIDKFYTFTEFLGDNLLLSNFNDNMEFVFRVSDDGNNFELWDTKAPPFLNAFSSLEKNKGYTIISNPAMLPYVLWDNCLDGTGSDSASDLEEGSGSDSDIIDGSDSGSDLEEGSDSGPDICYSNIFNLSLDTCPIDCYECFSNEIEQDIICDIGSDCSECYSPSLVIPVAC